MESERPESAFEDIFTNVPVVAKPKTVQKKWKGFSGRVKQRTYDVNLVNGAMPSYEPLADEHLQDYFNSPVTRHHLVNLGLISDDGYIIGERAFKTKQIQLDKRVQEDQIKSKTIERELDYDIEHEIRSTQKNDRVMRIKRSSDQKGPFPDFFKLFPVAMHKTALLYSGKPEAAYIGEQKLLERLKSQPPARLHSLGITKAHIETRMKRLEQRKLKEFEGQAARFRKAANIVNQSSRDSLVAIFEKAKAEYQAGHLGAAEAYLRRILEAVTTKGRGKSAPPKRDLKPPSRMMRPKSARPTRNSTFPVTSDFSDFGSDYETDLEDSKDSKSIAESKLSELAESVTTNEIVHPPTPDSLVADAVSTKDSYQEDSEQSSVPIQEKAKSKSVIKVASAKTSQIKLSSKPGSRSKASSTSGSHSAVHSGYESEMKAYQSASSVNSRSQSAAKVNTTPSSTHASKAVSQVTVKSAMSSKSSIKGSIQKVASTSIKSVHEARPETPSYDQDFEDVESKPEPKGYDEDFETQNPVKEPAYIEDFETSIPVKESAYTEDFEEPAPVSNSMFGIKKFFGSKGSLKGSNPQIAQVADAVPARVKSVEFVAQKVLSDPKLASKPTSVEQLASKPASVEQLASKVASQPKLASKPVSVEQLAAKVASQPKLASKPGSYDHIGSKVSSQPKINSKTASSEVLKKAESKPAVTKSIPNVTETKSTHSISKGVSSPKMDAKSAHSLKVASQKSVAEDLKIAKEPEKIKSPSVLDTIKKSFTSLGRLTSRTDSKTKLKDSTDVLEAEKQRVPAATTPALVKSGSQASVHSIPPSAESPVQPEKIMAKSGSHSSLTKKKSQSLAKVAPEDIPLPMSVPGSQQVLTKVAPEDIPLPMSVPGSQQVLKAESVEVMEAKGSQKYLKNSKESLNAPVPKSSSVPDLAAADPVLHHSQGSKHSVKSSKESLKGAVRFQDQHGPILVANAIIEKAPSARTSQQNLKDAESIVEAKASQPNLKSSQHSVHEVPLDSATRSDSLEKLVNAEDAHSMRRPSVKSSLKSIKASIHDVVQGGVSRSQSLSHANVEVVSSTKNSKVDLNSSDTSSHSKVVSNVSGHESLPIKKMSHESLKSSQPVLEETPAKAQRPGSAKNSKPSLKASQEILLHDQDPSEPVEPTAIISHSHDLLPEPETDSEMGTQQKGSKEELQQSKPSSLSKLLKVSKENLVDDIVDEGIMSPTVISPEAEQLTSLRSSKQMLHDSSFIEPPVSKVLDGLKSSSRPGSAGNIASDSKKGSAGNIASNPKSGSTGNIFRSDSAKGSSDNMARSDSKGNMNKSKVSLKENMPLEIRISKSSLSGSISSLRGQMQTVEESPTNAMDPPAIKLEESVVTNIDEAIHASQVPMQEPVEEELYVARVGSPVARRSTTRKSEVVRAIVEEEDEGEPVFTSATVTALAKRRTSRRHVKEEPLKEEG